MAKHGFRRYGAAPGGGFCRLTGQAGPQRAGLRLPRGTMGVMTAPILFGRDRELRAVTEMLERAAERGGGLLGPGAAGIGKTSVPGAARARAARPGFPGLP